MYLCKRLSAENEVHVVDVYGICKEYCDAVRTTGLPLHVLYPKTRNTYIGSKNQPLKRLWRMAMQVPEFLRIRKRLIQTILDIDPDVVWMNTEKAMAFAASSWKLRKYPLAMYVRGWATPDQVSPLLCWLMKRKVSAVITHAQSSVDQLRKRGVPQEKLYCTPNTVDFDQVRESAKTPCHDPQPRMNKHPILLLPAARPERAKGHHTAVQAIHLLKQKGFDPVLWLPGRVATGNSDEFLKGLQQKICEWDLTENVQFLGWRTDLNALIAACDIVILPSHTEGFPRAILEAMILGKPIVTTPVGGIPETIIHGVTGLLIHLDDAPSLVHSILELHTQPDLIMNLTKNAYDRVCLYHSSLQNTKSISAIFKSIRIMRGSEKK